MLSIAIYLSSAQLLRMQSTCTDLQRLADSGSGIICSRNPECNELRCNVTHFNIRALVRRATITVLPCNQPAAAQLVLYNSINTVILNETQDRTASHPFGNNLLSVQLMVTVEHPTGSQIRLGVKCLVNVLLKVILYRLTACSFEHPTGSQIRLGVKCLVNVFYTESNIVQIDCLQFLMCTFCLSIQISAAIRGSPNTVQLLSNTNITLNTSGCSQGRCYTSVHMKE